MSSTLTIRLDQETEQELAQLAAEGISRNAVIKNAIHEAYRQQLLARVHEESLALMRNESDLVEMRKVQEDMESLRAW